MFKKREPLGRPEAEAESTTEAGPLSQGQVCEDGREQLSRQ